MSRKPHLTESAKGYIKENYERHGALYCGRATGYHQGTCRKYAKSQGIVFRGPEIVENFIIRNYAMLGSEECAKQTGVSADYVSRIARRNGLNLNDRDIQKKSQAKKQIGLLSDTEKLAYCARWV